MIAASIAMLPVKLITTACRMTNSLLMWCSRWYMKLNLSKCSLIRFTNKKQPFITEYLIINIALSVVT